MKINKQNKAFTLVELMIVIAIIGVLAATLLPRLQGAQERSRDTGRVSSLTQTAAVLEVYFQDNSVYPLDAVDDTATAGAGCLSASNGDVSVSLDGLFTGGKAPTDPQSSASVRECGNAGSYGYRVLAKNGNNRSAYILIANIENNVKGNFLFDADIADNEDTEDTSLDTVEGSTLITEDAADVVFVRKS